MEALAATWREAAAAIAVAGTPAHVGMGLMVCATLGSLWATRKCLRQKEVRDEMRERTPKRFAKEQSTDGVWVHAHPAHPLLTFGMCLRMLKQG
jgi:hypothetical protein